MSAEDVATRFDKHEAILIEHAARLISLAEADKRLAAVDARLEDDIRSIRQMMHDGFAEGMERDTNNAIVLARIEGEAFKSIPGNLANQIAIHGLVWQVVGVVSALAVAVLVAYAKFHH
jgi:hypothetical protein